MREGSRTSLPSPPLLFIAFSTPHRSPLSERLEQASHFGAKTFGFFGLCPSSCQSTGFVSLAGKASLISISDAVLFLRS